MRRLFVLTALLTIALPTTAGAKVGGEDFHLQVSLPDSNGYSMNIWAEGHHHVGVLATKGNVSVSYTVKGRASSRRLDANFGALGRVHIRFHLKPELLPPALFRAKSCNSSRLEFFGGRFHGEVDFAGEPEVVGVTSHSGGVALVLYRKRVCKHRHRHRAGRAWATSGGKQDGEAFGEVDLFAAEAKPEGRTVSLELLGFAGKDRREVATYYHVSVAETLTRVEIVRSASDITRKEVLRLGKRGAKPTTASIALPMPFSGSATYSAEPGVSLDWSGDLNISLPGAAAVPLTGADFSTGLCRSFSEGEESHCTGSLEISPTAVAEIGR